MENGPQSSPSCMSSSQRLLSCGLCTQAFTNRLSLEAHVCRVRVAEYKEYSEIPDPRYGFRYLCSYCDAVISDLCVLQIHLFNHRSNVSVTNIVHPMPQPNRGLLYNEENPTDNIQPPVLIKQERADTPPQSTDEADAHAINAPVDSNSRNVTPDPTDHPSANNQDTSEENPSCTSIEQLTEEPNSEVIPRRGRKRKGAVKHGQQSPTQSEGTNNIRASLRSRRSVAHATKVKKYYTCPICFEEVRYFNSLMAHARIGHLVDPEEEKFFLQETIPGLL